MMHPVVRTACLALLLQILPTPSLHSQNCDIPWSLNGVAAADNGIVTLVPPGKQYVRGSAWNPAPIDLMRDFDYTFRMFLGSTDYGSDGIMFVLQNQGLRALGGADSIGIWMGYGNEPGTDGIAPSVAVEVDTYYNFEEPDPLYDHVAIDLNGSIKHEGAAAVQASATSDNIEDGPNTTCAWRGAPSPRRCRCI